MNENAPQHLATNLMAANIMLSALVSIIAENQFHGGIVYFDREKMFSRFEEFRKENNDEKKTKYIE